MNHPASAVQRTPLVAVYGTLKRGMHNHHWLGAAEFLGTDSLTTATLYDLGPYPGAKAEPSNGIEVEVFRVTLWQMADLDHLEGYDPEHPRRGIYERAIHLTTYGPAWLYLYNHAVTGRPVIRQGGWPAAPRHSAEGAAAFRP
jgi:gamma-glutamylcyclotransferase (GGCT)/AIG2-like uncharacterized protein YtfP